MTMTADERFMGFALRLAAKAAANGEAPIGCVITKDGEIVGRGFNRRESARCALEHAEIAAIRQACRKLGGWRLWQCELYVTLEPCPMCAGAIMNARLRRVVFGASDPKGGACGGLLNLFEYPVNHKPELVSGVRAGECSALLSGFFRRLRAESAEKTKGSDISGQEQ